MTRNKELQIVIELSKRVLKDQGTRLSFLPFLCSVSVSEHKILSCVWHFRDEGSIHPFHDLVRTCNRTSWKWILATKNDTTFVALIRKALWVFFQNSQFSNINREDKKLQTTVGKSVTLNNFTRRKCWRTKHEQKANAHLSTAIHRVLPDVLPWNCSQ